MNNLRRYSEIPVGKVFEYKGKMYFRSTYNRAELAKLLPDGSYKRANVYIQMYKHTNVMEKYYVDSEI
jgi:hypothetical protein